MRLRGECLRRVRLPALCALLLVSGAPVLEAAPAANIQLPPLVQPASGEHHLGKVIWLDLVTPDLHQAEQFYAGLFGWTFEPASGDPHYAVALLDGAPVAGILQRSKPAGQQRQPAWLTFIAAGDLEAVKRSALAHGARLLAGPVTYSQRGRQAIFADPEGAVFAVLASSSGDPPDEMAALGQPLWSSLMVADPDQEAAFYHALFGYDVYPLQEAAGATGAVGTAGTAGTAGAESADTAKHVILASGGFARAAVSAFPPGAAHRHAHWLNFVRVADVAGACAKAAALGGRVLVEPRIDRHGGRLAVVADASGAPIGLMEWSDTDSSQEPQ
ncbi:MAG TPA: VOC family protein [Steroidobacteraceae bacterium]